MSLRDAWDAQAEQWAVWARAPGHDSYWRFHRDRFLELLPDAIGGPILDLGAVKVASLESSGRAGRPSWVSMRRLR